MRNYILSLLLLISTSISAQYQPSGSKVRYINGIGLGSKLDVAFGTADSLVLYTKLDSTLMFKYKGTARALAYASALSGYVLYTDTAAMLTPYQRAYNAVTIAGTQTVTGAKTFTQNIVGLSFNSLQLRTNGYFDNFIGDSSGRLNTGIYANGFGRQALENNTGEWATAIGDGAGRYNTGNKPTNIGFRSGEYNVGNHITGIGDGSLQFNEGDNSVGVGNDAGMANTAYGLASLGWASSRYQSGINSSFIGTNTGHLNLGDYASGIGAASLYSNQGSYNSGIGFKAFNKFVQNVGAEKTFSYTAISFEASDYAKFYIPAHGFGSGWINLLYTEGTSPIPGMVSGTIYKLYALTADTLTSQADQFFPTGTGTGTGHKFTPQTNYTHSTALGAYSQPTADHQVMLGDTSTVEVKTYGYITQGFVTSNVLKANPSGKIIAASASDLNTTYANNNINLSNAYYLTGKLVSGTNIAMIGRNSSDQVLIDPDGYGVKIGSLGTGTVYSNSGVLTNTDPSDSTIKNTITQHKYGLAEIMKLQPKSFYYNSDTAKASLKYGFIAQEVQKVMPDMVRKIDPKDEKSKLGLESQGIYVTLVKAIQEQQAIIDDLKKRIIALENK